MIRVRTGKNRKGVLDRDEEFANPAAEFERRLWRSRVAHLIDAMIEPNFRWGRNAHKKTRAGRSPSNKFKARAFKMNGCDSWRVAACGGVPIFD